jgi:hypothetical protein
MNQLAVSLARTVFASILMAEVILLWLALLHFGGLLDLEQKVDAGLAVIGGITIGSTVFFATSGLLRSEEATILVRRLPLPTGLRAIAGD